MQVQSAKIELPAGELEFVGQAVHSAAPVDGLYFPAEHAAQLPPSGPEKPSIHVQIALPGSELEFDVHSVHVPPSGPEEPALQRQLVTLEL